MHVCIAVASHTFITPTYNDWCCHFFQSRLGKIFRSTQSHLIQCGVACAAIDMVGHQGDSIDICSDITAPDGTVLIFGLPPNSTGKLTRNRCLWRTGRFERLLVFVFR